MKDALARLLQGVDLGGNAGAVATTVAALRGGQAPQVGAASAQPVAVDYLKALGVGDANDVLNPGKVRDFVKNNTSATPEQIAKHMKQPGDLFRGVVEIDPKEMLPSPLGDALAGPITIETHTTQYLTAAGKYGNNVLLVGSDLKELVPVLKEIKKRGGIVIKDMTHRDQSFWVAGPKKDDLGKAFEGDNGVKDTTHRGILDVATDENGNDTVVFADWPVGYGHNLTGDYTPLCSVFSLDDMTFNGTPPSDAEKASYYDTVRTYEALYSMTVPFTNNDSRVGFTDYHFSPMEDTEAKDITDRVGHVVDAMSADPATAAKGQAALRESTFYCAEGAVACIDSAGWVPLNQASVDAGLLNKESFDKLKEMQRVFDAAGGQTEGKAQDGWKALVAAKLITQAQYDKLETNGMQHRPLRLSIDSLKPLAAYGAEGLTDTGGIVKPQHIGGLVQGMMHTQFPRETIAKGLAQRLIERASGPAAAQLVGGVAQMLGLPASTPLPQLAGAFGWAVSANFQEKMIESSQMQDTMRHAMGYDHMDAPSQKKVDDLIKKYEVVVADPHLDRAALDAKITALNKEAANTEINFPSLNWKGLIRHVPPQGSRDVLLGVAGASWPGLRPAFDILDKDLGT